MRYMRRTASAPRRAASTLRAAALALAALLAASAGADQARAQTTAQGPALDARAAAAEAEAARETAERARRSVEAIADERRRAAERIRSLGRRIVAREGWLLGADGRIDQLRRDILDAERRLERVRARLTILAEALQRINREPTPALLAHPGRPRAAARSVAQMRALVRLLEAAKAEARRELAGIAEAGAAARAEEAAARRERETLRLEIAEAEALLDEKRAAEAAAKERASAAEARAASLAARAESLGELAASLSEARVPPAPSPAQPDAAPRLETDIPFAEAEGRLLRPAAGRMSAVGGVSSGRGAIMITPSHARVIAPWRGVVRFAGPFKSHQAVIIEPETGYSILLTGFGEVTAREGETVAAGQLIGRMPRSASGGGRGRAELYIELFDRRAPLDPVSWFDSATREVGRE